MCSCTSGSEPQGPTSDDAGYLGHVTRLGYEGTVLVMVLIEPDGSISQAVVLQSSGHKLLDVAARAFFLQTRFKVAATLDGKPVAVATIWPHRYSLGG